MRRAALVVVASVLLVGCSSASTEEAGTPAGIQDSGEYRDAEANPGDSTSGTEGAIDVDSGLLNVEVTVSGDVFRDFDASWTPERGVADAEAEGRDARANGDGSITFTFTRSEYEEFVSGSRSETLETLQSDLPPYVTRVDGNQDLSVVTFYGDLAALEASGEEGFLAFSASFPVAIFRVFAFGSEQAEDFEVRFEDEETGQVEIIEASF